MVALEKGDAFVTESVRRYRELRDLVARRLSGIDGIQLARTEGTFYAFSAFRSQRTAFYSAELCSRKPGPSSPRVEHSEPEGKGGFASVSPVNQTD